jgi:AraC-like DNA-binding protein
MLLNFNDPDITIKSIAKQSFISEDYFRKLFKKEYGTSPQKYLINLRIQHAIQLMSGENFSLKEVAFMSGYKEYKYFSAEFKKIKGVSPSKYLLK